MADWFFDAPAGMTDFSDPRAWHDAMAEEARVIVLLLVATVLGKEPKDVTDEELRSAAPTLAYVNPLTSAPPAAAETVGIAPWGAFPRAVERRAPWNLPHDPDDVSGVYRASDHLGEEDHGPGQFRDSDGNVLNLPARDRQDEYLEWVVRRDGDGKLTKAIFVAEGYDYYAALFDHDEQKVVDLYQEFTGVTKLTADDLRAPRGVIRHRTDGRREVVAEPGRFNPRNEYNIDPGIVHLSHRANSLGAEVNLAGVSGLARKNVHGATLGLGNAELLLCCSAGGNPNRNSDPLIGEQAYAQVLGGRHYTLANPVGLYVAAVEEQRLTLPTGETAPREWWRVVRGDSLWEPQRSRVLRLELEVPKDVGLVLGDLLVDGNPIRYGGQLARLLSVHLFVTRWQRTGGGTGPIVGCDATCCRKTGTPQLVLSFRPTCMAGFELAFPDLLSPLAPAPTDAFSLPSHDIGVLTDALGIRAGKGRRVP